MPLSFQTLAPIRRFAHNLLDVAFPRCCAACDSYDVERGVMLCADCGLNIARNISTSYCDCCGYDVGLHLLRDGRCTTCENKRPVYEALRRVGRYETSLRDLILRFKYETNPTIDAMLGDMLADAIAADPAFAAVEVWVPVPSAFLRTYRRRFQPTRLLADRLAVRTRKPRCSALRLIRKIAEQKTLDPDQRVANVHDAFGVPRPEQIAGKVVGVVDDIRTTGATLREAARTLQLAGAERIYAVVLAVAQPGSDR